MPEKRGNDLVMAPIAEGALVLAVAAIGWASSTPLIFTSLGPTVYELVEQPKSKTARVYNIFVGHMLAMGSGFFALWVLNAWNSPKVASAGFIASPRMWAAVTAVSLTTFTTLALRANQPASLSTTLLVSLGSMQTARDALYIAVAVVLVIVLGEPVRRLRLRAMCPDG